jgi:hypothetical protein
MTASPGTIRTAYATDLDTAAAAAACREQLGDATPDLLLAFIGGRHGREAARGAITEAFGNVALIGGSAAGVISPAGTGYTGFELGIIAFTGADVTPEIVATHDMLESESGAGHALGAAVQARAVDGQTVMLLFDSVAETAPLRLHPASQLMQGFQQGLAGRVLHVIGGGLLTDINISDGWMIESGAVRKHAAAALIFPPTLTAATVILHGCRPVSSFIEITRIDGAEVLELDHQPALNVVEQRLGLELGTTSGQQLSLVATLGQKQGDPFAPYDENKYVNRLILQANPANRSITLFEPDFAVGTRVQIMSRDNDLMLESVQRGVAALQTRIAGTDCLLGLYIDCAGRASVMSGSPTEEAALVMETMAPEFPMMGFYSGVEIAPFAGDYSRPLDWTGVLSILQRRT